MSANVHRWRASSKDGFHPSPEGILKRLRQRAMQIGFICNSNNPTGQVLTRELLGEWADLFPETLIVADETYLAFVDGMESAISLKRKNILTLRSMTKDYAIAGLRLGYAVGEPTMIQAINNFRTAGM